MHRVLFVGLFRPTLSEYFESNGFVVSNALLEESKAIASLLEKKDFTAVVLGPRPTLGDEYVRKIRGSGYTSIILKIADHTDMDLSEQCVKFLDAGADNVVSHTACDEEVVRLILAALRLVVNAEQQLIRISGKTAELVINDPRKKVTLNGSLLRLTGCEYKVLHQICSRSGGLTNVELREQLYENCDVETSRSRSNVVQVIICRLRKKLQPHFTMSDARGRLRACEQVYKILSL